MTRFRKHAIGLTMLRARPPWPSELARIDSRIDSLLSDSRNHLKEESVELLAQLEARDFAAVRRSLARTDTLRDELDERIDAVRAEMVKVSYGAIATIRSEQNRAVLISAIVTVLAAIVGLIFANLVSGGIIRSVRQLLEGTRAVEAAQLDQSIDVTTSDEIGQLAAAFNRMVVQLRDNQRIRETFGKYIDPRVVEGLIDRPNLTAAEGERRVMTVLFCDLKGFTSLSEGMTPKGLVKVVTATFPSCPSRSEPTGGSSTNISVTASWPIGPPVRRRGRSRPICLSCRGGNDGTHHDAASGNSRVARRARHADGKLRSADRCCDRRGAGRQHRLPTS